MLTLRISADSHDQKQSNYHRGSRNCRRFFRRCGNGWHGLSPWHEVRSEHSTRTPHEGWSSGHGYPHSHGFELASLPSHSCVVPGNRAGLYPLDVQEGRFGSARPCSFGNRKYPLPDWPAASAPDTGQSKQGTHHCGWLLSHSWRAPA